jgi:SRSO17 transposase
MKHIAYFFNHKEGYMNSLAAWMAAFLMSPRRAFKWMGMGMTPHFVRRADGSVEVIDLVKKGNVWHWKM